MGHAAGPSAPRGEGRRAEHTYLARYAELQARNPWRPNLSPEQIAQVAAVVHPVVRTHPETGRKALFVSEHFTTRIVGLPDDESRALLDELFAHGVRAEHVYRHPWREHDLVFWDNRSLMHLAAGTPTTCAASCTARRSKATRLSEPRAASIFRPILTGVPMPFSFCRRAALAAALTAALAFAGALARKPRTRKAASASPSSSASST